MNLLEDIRNEVDDMREKTSSENDKFYVTDIINYNKTYIKGIVDNVSPEDYMFCVSKERVLESIEFINHGWTVLDVADLYEHVFKDSDIVVFRHNVDSIPKDVIEKSNILNTMLVDDPEKRDNIEHWFRFVKTERNLVEFKFKQIYEKESPQYYVTDEMREILNGEGIFIKFVNKRPRGRASSYVGGNLYEATGYSYDMIPLENEMLMSKRIKMDNEYRLFIVDGDISSFSTYEDYYDKLNIPAKHITMIYDFFHDMDIPFDKFPKMFVLDLFITGDKIDIVEFNPFDSSGRYIGNSVKLLIQSIRDSYL